MLSNTRFNAHLIMAYISLSLTPTILFAQSSERPDLEGIWTNASLTKLNRPSDVTSLIVSAEEAQIIAANTPIAGLEGGLDEKDSEVSVPDASGDDFGVRAYNNFWVEPGSNLALVKG